MSVRRLVWAIPFAASLLACSDDSGQGGGGAGAVTSTGASIASVASGSSTAQGNTASASSADAASASSTASGGCSLEFGEPNDTPRQAFDANSTLPVMCGAAYGSAGLLVDSSDVDYLKITTDVTGCAVPHPSLDITGQSSLRACLYIDDCADGPAFDACPAGSTPDADAAFGISGCCATGAHPQIAIARAHSCATGVTMYLGMSETGAPCNHYSYQAGL